MSENTHWLWLFMLIYQKSNLHYSRGIRPDRVTSCGAHPRGFAPRLHSFEGTSQRAIGDIVLI